MILTEEQDQSWCHTIGYLAPLVVGVALAAKLRRAKLDAAAIRALLDVSQDAHGPAEIAAAMAGTDRLIVAGAGHDAITARELALKVSEGASPARHRPRARDGPARAPRRRHPAGPGSS